MISRVATVMAMCLALASCHHDDGKTKLVIADQSHLSENKLKAAGALDGAPFDYQFANFAGASPVLEAMSAGAVDVGGSSDAPIIIAAAAHAPVKIVAAAHQPPEGAAILVPPNSPIHSIADLRGHEVIISAARGSIAHFLLLEALREAHVDVNQVRIGFLSPNDAAGAFSAGRIDAWGTFGNSLAIAESQGAHILRDGKGIVSGITVVAATDEALGDPAKRKAIADLLQRMTRAGVWSRAHSDAYAAIYGRQTRMPIDVARLLIQRQNPTLQAVDPAIIRDLQTVADKYYAYGVIKSHVDIAPIVDASLYPENPKP